MQYNLRLVQLLLDLHDRIGLLRVLVLGEVFFELGEVEGRGGRGEGGARALGEELVDDFGKELVRDEGGVVGVANNDASDAFGAAVGVKNVRLRESQSETSFMV